MLWQAIINIRITPDFGGDKAASGLEVVVPMPREVARVHCELGRDAKSGAATQSWDWQEKARRLVWKFKRVQGGVEHSLRVRSLCVPPCISIVLRNVLFISSPAVALYPSLYFYFPDLRCAMPSSLDPRNGLLQSYKLQATSDDTFNMFQMQYMGAAVCS